MGLGVRHRGNLAGSPEEVHELYEPDWKVWFAEEGDPRHGTPGRPAAGPDRCHRSRRGVPRDQQAMAGAALRVRQGVAHGHRTELGEMHALKEPGRATR